MSRKEVPRAGLLKAALAGKITNAQGALAVHLSLRQFHRVKRRFAAEGPGGLLHRLRGRASPRRLAAALRAHAAALLQGRYAGLNVGGLEKARKFGPAAGDHASGGVLEVLRASATRRR